VISNMTGLSFLSMWITKHGSEPLCPVKAADCYRFRTGPRAGWPRSPVTCSKGFMVPSLKCVFPLGRGGGWLLGQVIAGNCPAPGSLSSFFVDALVSSIDNNPLFIGVIPYITHGSFHVRCRRQRY